MSFGDEKLSMIADSAFWKLIQHMDTCNVASAKKAAIRNQPEQHAYNILKCYLYHKVSEMFFTISSMCVCSYSSVVERGRCSGNLVRRKLEQSTTVASHRHFGGHTGLLLQSLFNRVSSEPETNTQRLKY